MNEITQPHDRFIRLLLSDPEKAGTLYNTICSPDIPDGVAGW
ncbi:MAG: Rpn family recombination-promoting nuclease/putative transposase [Magnetococcales bacterium]|nr:Rpn family recombination-promoting nuclease/putative transposase [Magnetococcales bacterium]